MRGVAVARRAVSAFFRHKPPLRLSTRRAASGWCWAFASRVTSPPTLQGLSSYALRRPVQLAAAARTAIPTRVPAAVAVSSYGLLSRIRADQHQRRALHAEPSRAQGSGSNKAGSGSGAGENAGTPRSTGDGSGGEPSGDTATKKEPERTSSAWDHVPDPGIIDVVFGGLNSLLGFGGHTAPQTPTTVVHTYADGTTTVRHAEPDPTGSHTHTHGAMPATAAPGSHDEHDDSVLDAAADALVGGVDAITSGVKFTGDVAQGLITGSGAAARITAELAGNTAKAFLPQFGQVAVPGAVKGAVAVSSGTVGSAKSVVDAGVSAVTGVSGAMGEAVGSAVGGTIGTVSSFATTTSRGNTSSDVNASPLPTQRRRGPFDALSDLVSTTADVALGTVDTTVETVDSVITGGREAVVDVLHHTVGEDVRAL